MNIVRQQGSDFTKANIAFSTPLSAALFSLQERMNAITLPLQILKHDDMMVSLRSALESPAFKLLSDLKPQLQQTNISGIYAALDTYKKNSEIMTSALGLMRSNLSSVFETLNERLLPFNPITSEKIAGVLKTIDWSVLEGLALSDEFTSSEIVDATRELTPEDGQAFADDISEIINEPQNLEEKVQAKAAAWRQRHPILYYLFISMIIPLLVNMLSSYLTAKAQRNAHVYEEPTSSSGIIINVFAEQEIAVIGDVPYYYEIEITDPETGQKYAGYIYKAAVKFDEKVDADSDDDSK